MALKKQSFSKPQLIVFALVFAAIGGILIYRSFAAVTYTPRDMHVHRLEVDPNSYDLSSNAGNSYQFVWGKFQSATTEGSLERNIIWAPGHKYENRKVWVLWSWKPVQGRSPGRVLNFHTNPGWGGWTPDNSYGVSSLALDWLGDQVAEGGKPPGLYVALENYGWQQGNPGVKNYTVVPVAQMDDALNNGKWIDIVMEVDLNLYPSGGVRIWVNGNDTPAVDVRAGTVWPSQTGMLLWEGMYNSSGTSGTNIGEYMPARVGTSLSEALNDYPISEVDILGSYYKSNNQPAYRHSDLGTRNTSLFRLPPSLGGTSTPPAPTVSLSASPTTITAGQSSTLTWNSTNATTCTASGSWSGTKATSGTQTVTPTTASTYNLSCTGTGGSTSSSATVYVSVAPLAVTSSSINNGDTVANGTTWSATFSQTPSLVEFWANGSRISQTTTPPYSTVINLPVGANQLGLCGTLNGTRTCFGTGGVFANITVTANSVTGDLSGDGHVTITDLSILLTNYGSNNTTADIDKSGKVDITDLSILLSHYGT